MFKRRTGGVLVRTRGRVGNVVVVLGASRRLVALAAVVLSSATLSAACTQQVAAPEVDDADTQRVSDTSPPAGPSSTEAPSTRVEETTTTERPTTTESATSTTQKPTNTTWPSNTVVVGAAPVAIAAVGQGGGSSTSALQQRLLDLGFWLQGVTGSYDLTTSQAVMAFQKYKGLPASGAVDEATAAALTAEPQRAAGTSDAGTLVEIDKSRQILFLIRDGLVVWTFNTSTATGEEYSEADQNTPGELIEDVSITPNGLWQVERQRHKGWWKGDLGEIYRPKYFVGGVALHGSNSIPNYPASHGCVRVSTVAMDFIWDAELVPLRTKVWVHGEWAG